MSYLVETADLNSTVQNDYLPLLADNIFKYGPLLTALQKKMDFRPGGLKIVVPVLYKRGVGGSFVGDDVLDTTRVQKRAIASYDWKQKYANITIPGRDILLNMGGTQVLDLIDTEIQEAELTMQELFSEGIWDDGSADGNKEIDGLKAAISDADPAPGAYGGLAVATNTWWKAQMDTNAGTPRALTLALKQSMYSKCSQGNDIPDLIVTSDEVFNKAWTLLQGMQRSTAVEMFAGTKYLYIPFNQSTIIADKYIPNDGATKHRMYFYNTKWLQMIGHEAHRKNNGIWFDSAGFIRPTNQDVQTAKIYWMGNLICKGRRMSGLISNIDPAL